MNLLDFFRRKPKPLPVWEGKCSFCGGRVYSMDIVPDDPAAAVCYGCTNGWTDASKQRAADRRQIELIKTAIRELDVEKQST